MHPISLCNNGKFSDMSTNAHFSHPGHVILIALHIARMNNGMVTGRGLFKHYDDLRDQAEAAEEAVSAGLMGTLIDLGGNRPEEIQVGIARTNG